MSHLYTYIRCNLMHMIHTHWSHIKLHESMYIKCNHKINPMTLKICISFSSSIYIPITSRDLSVKREWVLQLQFIFIFFVINFVIWVCVCVYVFDYIWINKQNCVFRVILRLNRRDKSTINIRHILMIQYKCSYWF